MVRVAVDVMTDADVPAFFIGIPKGFGFDLRIPHIALKSGGACGGLLFVTQIDAYARRNRQESSPVDNLAQAFDHGLRGFKFLDEIFQFGTAQPDAAFKIGFALIKDGIL